jgi:hypothetical protein
MEIRMRNTGQLMTSDEFNRVVCTLPITTDVLNQHNADPVLEGPQPTPSRYQIVARDGVTNVNGQWFTFYKLVDLDAEGIAAKDAEQAKNVRQTRDEQLKALDWTQGKDIPDAISGPAAAKRQALRDVPAQAGFPWEVTWPDAE